MKLKGTTRLTSLEAIVTLHDQFKIDCIQNKNVMSGQKLFNRALHLYLTDDTFRQLINTHAQLRISGSQF